MRIGPAATLLLLNTALAALFAFAVISLGKGWQPPAPLVPDESTFAVNLPVSAPIDAASLNATLERPVFFASRRPLPPESVQAAPVAVADPFEGVRAVGVYSAGGGQGGIIVVEAGASRRVAVGEKLGEWTLRSLSGLEARFARDDQEKVLELKHAHPEEIAAAAPPPAAGARGDAIAGVAASPPVSASRGTSPAVRTMEDQIRERQARREAARLVAQAAREAAKQAAEKQVGKQ